MKDEIGDLRIKYTDEGGAAHTKSMFSMHSIREYVRSNDIQKYQVEMFNGTSWVKVRSEENP